MSSIRSERSYGVDEKGNPLEVHATYELTADCGSTWERGLHVCLTSVFGDSVATANVNTGRLFVQKAESKGRTESAWCCMVLSDTKWIRPVNGRWFLRGPSPYPLRRLPNPQSGD